MPQAHSAADAGRSVREQYVTATDAVRSQGQGLAGAVETGASALIAEITAAAERAAQSVQSMRASAAAGASSTGEKGQTGMTAAGEAAIGAGDQLVAQLLAALTSQVGLIQQSFGGAVTDFEGQLGMSVTDAVAHAREPLRDLAARIDEAMERAGRDAEKGWWESQWDNFVDMVSKPSFWVGLLVGLAVTVVAIALVGTMGPLGLAIVGAIAGGLSAGASTVTDNVLSDDPNRRWYTGVGQAMAVGAVAGAIGGALGGFGSQAVGAVFRVGAQEAATMTAVELAAVAANEQLAQRVVGVGLGTAQGIAMNVYNGDPWDKNLMANTAQGIAMSYLPNERMAEGLREATGIPEGGYGTPAPPPAPDAPRSAAEWLKAREAAPPAAGEPVAAGEQATETPGPGEQPMDGAAPGEHAGAETPAAGEHAGAETSPHEDGGPTRRGSAATDDPRARATRYLTALRRPIRTGRPVRSARSS